MPITIKELGRRLETVEVPFRGQTVTLRALTANQRLKIRQIMPAPTPPYMENPAKGEPPIPDVNHAGYRDKARNWSIEVATVDVAFALGITTQDGTPCPPVTDPAFLPWARAAAVEIRDALTDAELAYLQERLAVLESGDVRSAGPDPSSSRPIPPG